MAASRSFRELNVYKLARDQARPIFEMTSTFPKEETYPLTDQIRRSSRAVNAMIAETWVRRQDRAAFVNKIDESLGEARETQAWLDHALDCGYVTSGTHKELDVQWQRVGAMLQRMLDRAETFCKAARG